MSDTPNIEQDGVGQSIKSGSISFPFNNTGAGTKLRQTRLSVYYEQAESAFHKIYPVPIHELVGRVSLLVFLPVVQPLPEIFLKVIGDCKERPLDVLVVTPEQLPLSDEMRQEIGELLRRLHDRKLMSVRWTSSPMPGFRIDEVPVMTLLLQDAEVTGDNIVMFVRRGNTESVKVTWSWGDPLKRAATISSNFRASWTKSEMQSFTPQWDLLGLDATGVGYSMPALYKHQTAAIKAWQLNGFRGIFEMCTGAGKTVAALAGSLLLHQDLQSKGQLLSCVAILCPKRVLVEQWERELLAKGFKVSALVYDAPQNYLQQLDTALRGNKPRYIISTYDSFALPRFQSLLKTAAESGRRGLLIADEMHWCASTERRAYLHSCERYFPWRLGLSATPEIEYDELATKQLLEYFGGILEGARYGLEEALRDKVLCPYVYHPVPTFLDPVTSAKYFEILRRTTDRTGKVDLAAYSERRKILRRGEMQIRALETICDQITTRSEKFDHTLVFCPPGADFDDSCEDVDETTPVINRIKRVFEDREILCTSILAETTDRELALKEFANGTVSILLAIGCLDEGMDVPSTRRAIMLYSVDRLRQFVQRRGRVLRKHPNKVMAEIIDLIVLPHNAELPESIADTLLRRELRRYTEFARLATNAKEAEIILENAIRSATGRNNLIN